MPLAEITEIAYNYHENHRFDKSEICAKLLLKSETTSEIHDIELSYASDLSVRPPQLTPSVHTLPALVPSSLCTHTFQVGQFLLWSSSMSI